MTMRCQKASACPDSRRGRANPQSSGSGRRPAKPSSTRCQQPISSSPSCQQRSTVSPRRSAGKSMRPLSRSFTWAPWLVISSTSRASRRATRVDLGGRLGELGGRDAAAVAADLPLELLLPLERRRCAPGAARRVCSTSGRTCSSSAFASSGVKWRMACNPMLRRVEVDAAQPRPRRWYLASPSGPSSSGCSPRQLRGALLRRQQHDERSHVSVYSYSTFAGGMIFYAIWLGIVLADRDRPLRPARAAPAAALGRAARRSRSAWSSRSTSGRRWSRTLPLPESPGKEQGLTPSHWEPAHAGAFAANFVLFAVVAPFVEELTFRGAGQSLLALPRPLAVDRRRRRRVRPRARAGRGAARARPVRHRARLAARPHRERRTRDGRARALQRRRARRGRAELV